MFYFLSFTAFAKLGLVCSQMDGLVLGPMKQCGNPKNT